MFVFFFSRFTVHRILLLRRIRRVGVIKYHRPTRVGRRVQLSWKSCTVDSRACTGDSMWRQRSRRSDNEPNNGRSLLLARKQCGARNQRYRGRSLVGLSSIVPSPAGTRRIVVRVTVRSVGPIYHFFFLFTAAIYERAEIRIERSRRSNGRGSGDRVTTGEFPLYARVIQEFFKNVPFWKRRRRIDYNVIFLFNCCSSQSQTSGR